MRLRPATAIGLIGLAAMCGFGARLWLLGVVDARGMALAIGAATLLLLYAWLDADVVAETSSQRGVQLGAGSFALVLLAALAAAATHGLVRSADRTFDLSSERHYSIAPHTRAVLGELREPVQLIAFFPRNAVAARQLDRLTRAMAEASPQLSVRMVDPLRSPLEAERYGVTSETDTVVVEQGERRELLVRRHDETALVNAILRLTSGRQHRVCWSTGHGEALPDDDDASDAMSAAVLALEGQNYQVTLSSLLSGPPDPGCEALVIAAPRLELQGWESDLLATWLAAGGRALLLLEPGAPVGLTSDLSRFGLQLDADIVLDPDPSRSLLGRDDPSTFLLPAPAWAAHPIGRALAGAVVVQGARSVRHLPDTPGVAARALATASPASWAETQLLDPAAPIEPDPDEWVGSVGLAAALEITDPNALEGGAPRYLPPGATEARSLPLAPGGRLVVIGDASFATNQLVDLGSNLELFLASIAWLVDEPAQLAPRPALASDKLEISELGGGLLCLFSGGLLPGLPLLLALRAYWRRRGA
jgi:hypothetical protein